MDTTQRITLLCDGDKRLIYQGLEDCNDTSIAVLQVEYSSWLWYEECSKVLVVLKDQFTSAIKEMWEVFKKSFGQINTSNIVPISKSRQKDWHRYKQASCNNYRKLHALPLVRRMRCRWRPRESRRSLDGLSPSVVIIDEYAFSDEQG